MANEKTADPGERPTLLTIAEVAKWLGLSTQSLYRWRSESGGGPPAIRMGSSSGRLRWRAADVEAWLIQQTEAR